MMQEGDDVNETLNGNNDASESEKRRKRARRKWMMQDLGAMMRTRARSDESERDKYE